MHERILTLLYKSISGLALDASEKKELEEWMARSPYYRLIFKEIKDKEKLSGEIKEWLRDDIELPDKIIRHFLNAKIKTI